MSITTLPTLAAVQSCRVKYLVLMGKCQRKIIYFNNTMKQNSETANEVALFLIKMILFNSCKQHLKYRHKLGYIKTHFHNSYQRSFIASTLSTHSCFIISIPHVSNIFQKNLYEVIVHCMIEYWCVIMLWPILKNLAYYQNALIIILMQIIMFWLLTNFCNMYI